MNVVSYFLSRREADADSARFLAAVVPQLAYYLAEEDPPPAELHTFRALWQRAADRAAAAGRHLLLVVDGLDEDLRPPGLPSVAALLPTGVGGRVHVLLSSRLHPELPRDLPVAHPLGSTRPVVVEPFGGAEGLAALARQEIDDVMRRDASGLAADVLGLLTAAGGPLAVEDLAALTVLTARSAARTRQIRRVLTVEAARSLQPVGPAGGNRYQFAHDSLLEYAQTNEDLTDPEFRRRIHQWAQMWRDADWPGAVDGEEGTPRYLLDTYPATLARDPQRLAALVSDAGWVDAAIRSAGVDRVLADLRRAAAAAPAHPAVGAMLAAVVGQAHRLRPSQPVDQPGYVMRQLCLRAAELGEDRLTCDLRARLRSQPGPGLVPLWTTRRTSRALAVVLGRHDGRVRAVAVLPDGRVVSGGWDDGRVLVWDPARAGSGPVELGRHGGTVWAVAVLPDGRVVSGGGDGRVLAWVPAGPGDPVELGRHDGNVIAVAVLPDGRVVSGGWDGRALVWDPARGGSGPVELGRQAEAVGRVAVLPDGRVVSGGDNGRVLVWDPARAGSGPVELGGHDDPVRVMVAVAVLPDGRVVSGGDDGRVLVWVPARAGSGPVELGRHDGPVFAVAVLPDGRVVGGGDDGQVLMWVPARAGSGPVELGRHDGQVWAVAVLPDGRVVSGGDDGQVLVWDPARAGSGPVELARHDGNMIAVAVLPDGRVVSGGAGRAGTGLGPGPGGQRPRRARPPRRPGGGRGGAAGRAGGQRRGRRAGADVGASLAGQRPGRARPSRRPGVGGGGAAGRAGGQRRQLG